MSSHTTNSEQLTLIDGSGSWRLDDETRRIGRIGLANARSILRATRPVADIGADMGGEPTERTAGDAVVDAVVEDAPLRRAA